MQSPRDLVQHYLEEGFRIVTWAQIGDDKGPRTTGWTEKHYTIEDYKEGNRVGILSGHEIKPGVFNIDVDIDWAEGSRIAQFLIPPTEFVYGRQSKRISHCFYTTSEPLTSFKYEDINKDTLIELRGTTKEGAVGLQSMAPPSIWSKKGQVEPLLFVKFGTPAHIASASALKQRVCLSAIAMLLARHLGKHGFGHEARLCWAGFLLRAGLSIDELSAMGEAISDYCDNREVKDVRLVLDSTSRNLSAGDASIVKKVKGGPALAKLLGTQGKAVIKRINEWLGRDSDFIRNNDGMIIKEHQENIRRALNLLNVELSFNEFSDKLLMNKRALEDRELIELWLRVDEEYRFRPSYAFFEKVVKRTAWDNSFHPVKEYLSTLQWDRVPRIDTWLIQSCEAEDTMFVRAISAIMLIAAVRRVKEPGCKYDELVVLESGQGLNKSSALRALCPNPEWFSDDLQLNIKSQQMIEATLGKWIIEASELSGLRPAQVEQLKSTLSRQVDGPARMAYAHMAVERARQFIIVGTTNAIAYLVDSTGGRRFWPVNVKNFDVSWIVANRDQLWAEAVQREHAGETIRLPESLWCDAGDMQEKRREVDPWETIILHALQDTPEFHEYGDNHTRVVTDRLWTALSILPERQDRAGQQRISQIMQRIGFKPTAIRVTKDRLQRGYISNEPNWLDITHVRVDTKNEQHDARPTRQPGDEDEEAPF
jgi:hypothetical protein